MMLAQSFALGSGQLAQGPVVMREKEQVLLGDEDHQGILSSGAPPQLLWGR